MAEPLSPVAALVGAAASYRARLVAIDPGQWDEPSVCDGWSVRDVADHVVGGNRFAVGALGGLSADDALARAMAPGFDGDPVALFDASVAPQTEAFSAPGALDGVVHHVVGDLPASLFIGLRAGDMVLHGWDLARSTGGDEHLDPTLVEVAWAVYEPVLAGTAAATDRFGGGPSGSVPATAPLVERLLDLTGRRP